MNACHRRADRMWGRIVFDEIECVSIVGKKLFHDDEPSSNDTSCRMGSLLQEIIL